MGKASQTPFVTIAQNTASVVEESDANLTRRGYNKRSAAIALCLVVLTAAAFWSVHNCGFIILDDHEYVLSNSHVQKLDWETVRWAFTSSYAANWHPITWLSHALDWQFYGSNPSGHHLTSLAIHILNGVLLFLVLQRMIAATWPSAVVAALFAVHPLHVESVAWISERKDVLSTLFFLLSTWAYVRYVEKRNGGLRTIRPTIFGMASSSWFVLSLLLFALGLMSKPMVVTLPLVLLLLDYWPLKRMRTVRTPASQPATYNLQLATLVRLLIEKLPFFFLSLGSCLATLWAQRSGGAVRSLGQFPWEVRLQTVLVGYATYLWKTICPTNLSILNPHPGGWPIWRVIGAATLLIAITVVAVRLRKRRPYLLMGWLWFAVTLLPVIGFVQVGSQSVADRYAYIPLVGIFTMLAWTSSSLLANHWRGWAFGGLSGLALVACFGLTRQQVQYWKSSVPLFQHALQVSLKENRPDDIIGASLITLAHDNLGQALTAEGKLDEAVEHYAEALRLVPSLPDYKPGTVLQIQPDYAEIHDHLGHVLAKQGKLDEALAHFAQAAALKPLDPTIHYHLAMTFERLGKASEAISEYDATLRLQPNFADALNNFAWLRATHPSPQFRDGAAAVKLAERACELTGHKRPLFLGTLAAAYAEAGRFPEAIGTAERASVLALAANDKALAAKNQELKALYERGVAYHESE